MWLEILKNRRKELGYTFKYISQESKFPERTVSRIFSGETLSPGVDTLYPIATVLGLTLDELFVGTDSIIGGKDYRHLLEENLTLTERLEKAEAELALTTAENSVLKDKITALTTENGLLRIKLEHKEEIISLHNYYNKLKSGS